MAGDQFFIFMSELGAYEVRCRTTSELKLCACVKVCISLIQ